MSDTNVNSDDHTGDDDDDDDDDDHGIYLACIVTINAKLDYCVLGRSDSIMLMKLKVETIA